MTMHARNIGAVAPVAPDKVDAIAGGCGKAGLEGGAKPLWTLGLVLLVVL